MATHSTSADLDSYGRTPGSRRSRTSASARATLVGRRGRAAARKSQRTFSSHKAEGTRNLMTDLSGAALDRPKEPRAARPTLGTRRTGDSAENSQLRVGAAGAASPSRHSNPPKSPTSGARTCRGGDFAPRPPTANRFCCRHGRRGLLARSRAWPRLVAFVDSHPSHSRVHSDNLLGGEHLVRAPEPGGSPRAPGRLSRPRSHPARLPPSSLENGSPRGFAFSHTKGALVCYKTQPSETLHSAPGNAPLRVRQDTASPRALSIVSGILAMGRPKKISRLFSRHPRRLAEMMLLQMRGVEVWHDRGS